MKCKRCHKQIPERSKFCCYCGKPTSEKKLYRRQDGLYIVFLLYTGLRKGEALALTYSDIDRENKRIKVTKSAHQL